MSKSKRKPALPKAGFSSPEAVGRRLQCGRADYGSLKVAEIAKKIDATPEQYRAYESGKAMIPPRQLWLFAWQVWGPREWLLTGTITQRPIPDELPALGDDLTGFAARIKEARERLGFKIKDVEVVFAPVEPREWQQWENADDEPRHELAVLVARMLEVDLTWLYTDTEPPARRNTKAKPRGRFEPEMWLGQPAPGIGKRLKAAREAAGISLKDASLFTGRLVSATMLRRIENETSEHAPNDENLEERIAALGVLYGVPLETLLYSDAELIILRRRVERLRRRFGLPSPPGKRQADAA